MVRWCVGVALAAFVAGCGSTSSSSSSSGTAAAPSSSSSSAASPAASAPPGLAQAQQATAKAEKVPNTIGISTPLTKKPAPGKTIVFLRCDQPVCAGYADGLTPAAAALGWHMKYLSFTQTPQGIQSAINTAIQMHPDGLFFTGQPAAEIKPLLPALKKAKIPVVSGFDDNVPTPGGPDIANVATYPNVDTYARVMADWLTADSKGKANVGLFDIPSLPILASASTAFQQELAKLCPACKSTVVHQQITDLGGTAIASSVVSTLQSHPDMNYVGFVFGDMVNGVPAALRAASVQTQAKLFVYSSSSPPNLVDLSKGAETADTAFSIPYFGWRAIDAFARYYNRESTAIDSSAFPPGQILTKSNVILGTNWNFAVDPQMAQKFKTLWHVSG
jgi:ribose transport system substrate-binding protein